MMLFALLLAPSVVVWATSAPSIERERYGSRGSVIVVHAPHATLRLRLATLVGEELALQCVIALPPHGGMLLVARTTAPTLFGPRYAYARTDSVALNDSSTVIAVVLDARRQQEEPGMSGSLFAPSTSSTCLGRRSARRRLVRATASASTPTHFAHAERDHSVPARILCREPEPLAPTGSQRQPGR